MKSLPTKVYFGKLDNEKLLCELEYDIFPSKNDLIFYKEEIYKVMYCLFDADDDEYSVFVRRAVEEDY